MNEESRNLEKPTVEAATKRPPWLPVAILIGLFALGFVPLWLKSNRLDHALRNAELATRLQAIQITLADAVMDARRGEYESARKGTAAFFALVNVELERGIGSALPPSVAKKLKPLLAQRDDLITLLARSDPASAERLATSYEDFRISLGQ